MPTAPIVLLHVLAVVVWVGGMFFALFALRPAATEVLAPPLRLPLLAAAFGRFFRLVAIAIAVILASGFARLSQVGFAVAPLHWHVMAGLGLAMTLIFVVIWRVRFARLVAACAAQDWPGAARAANDIRQLVGVNLALGIATIAVALWQR